MDDTTRRAQRRRTQAGTQGRAKGIAAIAIGAALLLGGGTTLAYWSDSLNLNTTPVATGDLDLVPGTASWTLNGADVTSTIGSVKIVPGDVLVRTETVGIVLVGDTIKANLTLDQGSVTLPAHVSSSFAAQIAGSAVTNPLTSANNGDDVVTTVTFTFDSATPDQDDTNASIDLSQIDLVLTQVP